MIRSVGWSLLHQAAGRGAVFLFFAWLPRLLPMADVGRFTLTYTLWLLLLQPAFDTALGSLVTRRVASGDGPGAGAALRLGLRAGGVALAGLALATATQPGQPALALACAFALALPLSAAFAVARGLGRLDVEGQVGTLQKLLLPPLLLLLERAGLRGPSLPAWALAAAALLGLLLLAALHGATLRRAALAWAGAGAGDGAGVRGELLRLTALGAVTLAYGRLNLGLLAWLESFEAVGRFATAARWVEAGYVVPFALTLALAPRVAARGLSVGEARRALLAFGALGLAAWLAVRLAAGPLLRLAYGEAGSSLAGIVSALAPCLPLVFVGTPAGQALVALDRGREALGLALLALAVAATAGLVGIPVLGLRGATLAAVATEATLALGAIYCLLWRRGSSSSSA